MGRYLGYLLIVDEPERVRVIEQYIESDWTFTDTMSIPDSKLKSTTLFFISIDGKSLKYASLGTIDQRVATQKNRVRFSNHIELQPPIPFDIVEQHLDERMLKYFVRSSQGIGSYLPDKTLRDLIDLVKYLRPEQAEAIKKMEDMLDTTPEFFSREPFRIIGLEKDAINLSLRVSGFNYAELLKWTPSYGVVTSFISGLTTATITEDQMVAHDAEVFGDWDRIKRYQVGIVVFKRHGERLTIMNVNRHKIENTLGVDLIYYQEKYDSYIMVQYKRMKRENLRTVYRPIDASYKHELQRMLKFDKALSGIGQGKHTDLTSYRLNRGPFYFKLCPENIFYPYSTEMISGMYLPLEYWTILVNLSQVAGPRGGIAISHNNVGRYLNNSIFIELVQAGWIGSQIAQKTYITEIISQALDEGRSVMLSTKMTGDP